MDLPRFKSPADLMANAEPIPGYAELIEEIQNQESDTIHREQRNWSALVNKVIGAEDHQ